MLGNYSYLTDVIRNKRDMFKFEKGDFVTVATQKMSTQFPKGCVVEIVFVDESYCTDYSYRIRNEFGVERWALEIQLTDK